MAGVAFKRLDAFAKTRPDLQQKSVTGGIITLIATASAFLLLIGQIILYMKGDAKHSLSLSRSITVPLIPLQSSSNKNQIVNQMLDQQGRTTVYIHVTFPHVSCQSLDIIHDGASLLNGDLEKIHGSHTLELRKPFAMEFKKMGMKYLPNSGCTVLGYLRPYIVAGSFAICLNMETWAHATTALSMGGLRDFAFLAGGGIGSIAGGTKQDNFQQYNVSHYIHSIRFGHMFSKVTDKPLEDVSHIIHNDFHGIAVAQTQVKLIPTIHVGSFYNEQMYQMSVIDIMIQPHTLVAQGGQQLPGLTVSYDFTPLTVHHSDGREPFLVFISSLLSIVGGVFVTVGMLTGCLVHSAQAVAKKID
jgi:Endoplasmic reticulum vesicle transporter/Endoplasmic Reticulum-Golgi Intermediate Compartment (ERGIC)